MSQLKARTRLGFGRVEKCESGRFRVTYPGPEVRRYRAPVTIDAKDDAIA